MEQIEPSMETYDNVSRKVPSSNLSQQLRTHNIERN